MKLTNLEIQDNIDGTYDISGLDEGGNAVVLTDCYPIAVDDQNGVTIPDSAKGVITVTFKYELCEHVPQN